MRLPVDRLSLDGTVLRRFAALIAGGRSDGVVRAESRRELDGVRAKELVSGLLRQKEDLQALKELLNAEFLQLAGTLKEMAALARTVRAKAGEVVSLASSGGGESSAVQFSFHLLKKAEDLVQASYEQYEFVFKVFEELKSGLAALAKRRVGLARITAPLSIITVQLRIQASFLEETRREQFQGLSKQVEQLVMEVGNEVAHRFEQLSITERDSAALAGRLATELRQHRERVERTLQSSREHLTVLAEALAQSDGSAQLVLERGRKLGSTIGEVVMALQCDDMATQRIQHLSAACDEMIARLERHEAAPGTGGPRFVAATAKVQQRQFEDLYEQLLAAGQAITSGLSGVRSAAQDMAEVAMQASQAGGGMVAQHSVDGMREILSMVHLTLSTTESVAGAVAPLERELSDCTRRLVSLALGARLVALNAQVFANRVEEGAALEVVADRIRMCSDELLQELEQMSDVISGLAGGITNVRGQIADFRELGEAEQSILTDESRATEADLHDTEERLKNSLLTIEQSRRELALLDSRISGDVRFPPALDAARAKLGAFLEELAQLEDVSAPGDESEVDRLLSNYTMEHERNLHRMALERELPRPDQVESACPEGAAGAGAPVDDVELFGDDVELFGDEEPAHETTPDGTAGREVPDCHASPEPAPPGEALGDNVELF